MKKLNEIFDEAKKKYHSMVGTERLDPNPVAISVDRPPLSVGSIREPRDTWNHPEARLRRDMLIRELGAPTSSSDSAQKFVRWELSKQHPMLDFIMVVDRQSSNTLVSIDKKVITTDGTVGRPLVELILYLHKKEGKPVSQIDRMVLVDWSNNHRIGNLVRVIANMKTAIESFTAIFTPRRVDDKPYRPTYYPYAIEDYPKYRRQLTGSSDPAYLRDWFTAEPRPAFRPAPSALNSAYHMFDPACPHCNR